MTEHYNGLSEAGIEVLGVSLIPAKHLKFIEKYDIAFDLACDEDLSLHKAFGVWGLKNSWERNTKHAPHDLLIDENGSIAWSF